MKLHSPSGYALAIGGAAVLVYLMPQRLRLPVALLAVASGVLLLRGGIDGLKKDFTG